MSTHAWFDDASNAIRGFDLGRCHWLLGVEVWEDEGRQCCRLVLDYEDRLSVALVARGVRELPLFKSANARPGVLPYAPYDVGELLVSRNPATGLIVIFDELNGWRMAADSLSFDGARPHDATGTTQV